MLTMALEFCLAFSNKETAENAAENYGGRLYEDVNDRDLHIPFAALLCTTNPNLNSLLTASDVGGYLVDRRVMKTRDLLNPLGPQPGVVGVFSLVANASMGHDAADRHNPPHGQALQPGGGEVHPVHAVRAQARHRLTRAPSGGPFSSRRIPRAGRARPVC